MYRGRDLNSVLSALSSAFQVCFARFRAFCVPCFVLCASRPLTPPVPVLVRYCLPLLFLPFSYSRSIPGRYVHIFFFALVSSLLLFCSVRIFLFSYFLTYFLLFLRSFLMLYLFSCQCHDIFLLRVFVFSDAFYHNLACFLTYLLPVPRQFSLT